MLHIMRARWTVIAVGLLAIHAGHPAEAGAPPDAGLTQREESDGAIRVPTTGQRATHRAVAAKAMAAMVTMVVTKEASGRDAVPSQGSGFAVTPDGAVLTAWDVVAGAQSVEAQLSTGQRIPVLGLLGGNEESDFALLKLARTELPVAPMGDSDEVRPGDGVLALSAPLGTEATIAEGILSGACELSSGRKLMKVTAPLSSEGSGGPVLNMDGEVIGIASFVLIEGQDLSFAVAINDVKASLRGPRKVQPLSQAARSDGAQALYLAGALAGSDGELEKAVSLLQKAVTRRRDFAEAHFALGLAYASLGRHQDAVEALQEAIRLKPDDAEAHYHLGFSYTALDRCEDAVAACKEAIRLKPDYAEAHAALGLAYILLAHYEDAVAACKEAIRLKPNDTKGHYYLGLTYMSMGDRKGALDEYNTLLGLDRDVAAKLFKVINP